MSRSRAMSLIEATANVVVGYLLAVLMQLVVFPLFGIEVSLLGNFALGAFFTAASLVRSYALRRLFEALREQVAETMAIRF